MSKPQTHHYVDNIKFYDAMKEYIDLVAVAKSNGLKKTDPKWPRVSEYIGECFVKIAKHLAFKANFINYSYRDEMISDGIENCLRYADNFDPYKYKNPFAYFTQIIYFAFIRRIQSEKKELAKKYKYIENLDITDMITQGHDDGEFTNEFLVYLKEQLDQVDAASRGTTEKAKPVKKTKKRIATIDEL